MTSITAAQLGGIDVDATLDSRVTTSPNLENFTLLASGANNHSFATNDATVVARVGRDADLTSGGPVDVLADFLGVSQADAAVTNLSGGVSVASASATAEFTPNVVIDVETDSQINTAGNAPVSLDARLNYVPGWGLLRSDSDVDGDMVDVGFGAIGDATQLSVGIGGSISNTVVTTESDADLAINVDPGSNIVAGTGDILVSARNSNNAFSTLVSRSGAAVNVSGGSVLPTAEGSTTVNFLGRCRVGRQCRCGRPGDHC